MKSLSVSTESHKDPTRPMLIIALSSPEHPSKNRLLVWKTYTLLSIQERGEKTSVLSELSFAHFLKFLK